MNKKLYIASLALAAAVLVAAPAHAERPSGWYLAAGAGAGISPDMPVFDKDNLGTTWNNYRVSFRDPAYGIFGAGGYAFDNGLRAEVEYLYQTKRFGPFGKYCCDPVPAKGRLNAHTLFLNAFYDMDLVASPWFVPYIGAGIGPSFGYSGHMDFTPVSTTYRWKPGNDVVAAYQAIFGTSFILDRNWALTADYRYLGVIGHVTGKLEGVKAGRINPSSHNVFVGVRYTFGPESAPAECPPAPPPPEPIRPVAMQVPVVREVAPMRPAVPATQSFMVFFDFDKDLLTPEAREIIRTAVRKFKEDGYAKIAVTGHTDTMGSAEYNMDLSIRRAEAVRKELEMLGVSSAHIRTTGEGKHNLLVPTTQGVREAQNRRAEIILSR
ncbi:MAG: OmpA family protein [Alphaproteobacteria bacterium]|nr:OmpA family protein [Alphaproteobacteria bacterium]MCL2505569.1 OmpA family protein [Alphaproteobacteria bacterium]